MPTATLRASGGVPEVEIIVGHLHRADYEFWLYDPTGANPVLIGKGKTGDSTSDKFPLPTPVTNIDRHLLWWQAGVVSHVDAGASEPFVVTIRVVQDDAVAGSDGGTGTSDQPHTKGMLVLQVAP